MLPHQYCILITRLLHKVSRQKDLIALQENLVFAAHNQSEAGQKKAHSISFELVIQKRHHDR